MTDSLFFNRRFIVTGLLVVFSLVFLALFQENEKVNPIFQTLMVSIAFFLVIPVLYSKIVLKESLKNLGWQKGSMFSGIALSIFCVAIALTIVFFLTRYTSFSEEYIFPNAVQTNFVWFMLYELILVLFTALLYEVFFRGLVQFTWLRNFGFWVIFFQAGLFVGLFYLSDDISWQKVPILLFSPFAGIIAYYSHSLWYSWAASWTFFFLTDVFLLVLK